MNRRRHHSSKERGDSLLSLISSIAALLISVITALYNLVGYFEKPELSLLPPEQVTFYSSYAGDWSYVTMVTDFNVFNDSRTDKYGLVVGEALEFTIEGVPRVLRWQQIGKWIANEFQPTGPAQPLAIAGGAVSAQEVTFEPRSKPKAELRADEKEGDNWVDWEAFLQALRKGDLKLRCVIELHGGKKISSEVEARVTPGVLAALENPDPKKRWAAVACKQL